MQTSGGRVRLGNEVLIQVLDKCYRDDNGVTYWHCSCGLPGDGNLVCVNIELFPDAKRGDWIKLILVQTPRNFYKPGPGEEPF